MIVLWETSSERLTSIWHSASGWFFETASSRSSVLQEPRRFHHEWRVLKFFSRKFLLETLEFYTKNLWLPTWEALQATLVTLHDSLDNHVMRFSCKTCDRFDRPLNGEMVSDLRLPGHMNMLLNVFEFLNMFKTMCFETFDDQELPLHFMLLDFKLSLDFMPLDFKPGPFHFTPTTARLPASNSN